LIDFHCHLDLFDDPEMIASQSEAADIYVLSVTTTPKAWRKTSALSKHRRHIKTALGLHPQLAHERHQELPLFEALLDETRYVGEIGLDGSREFRQYAEIQSRVFERVLSFAQDRGGRIYTIHSRGAADAVVSTLKRLKCSDTAVLHWFSGTKSELKMAVASGCWFSVGPAMLRSAKGKSLVELMPPDRVLTETDGPFAQMGGRALKPADVQLAVAQLADLWGLEAVGVHKLLASNLRELVTRVPNSTAAQIG
jgi:TatD DNase family protein